MNKYVSLVLSQYTVSYDFIDNNINVFSRELYVLSENQLFTWNIVRVRQGSFSEKVTRKESCIFI